jgi:hypothetical protein
LGGWDLGRFKHILSWDCPRREEVVEDTGEGPCSWFQLAWIKKLRIF